MMKNGKGGKIELPQAGRYQPVANTPYEMGNIYE
jgi:hypothetical protein